MTIDDMQRQLARPAVEFATGGFRPTHAAPGSWIGRGRAGEELPLDNQGRPMWPLLQLVLTGMPVVLTALAGTQALTVLTLLVYFSTHETTRRLRHKHLLGGTSLRRHPHRGPTY